MNVKPLSDRVLILPNPAEEKTAGGLIIPDTAKEKPQRDTVRRKRQEDDYSGLFLRRNEIKTRQCVYISRDVHSKILKIVNDIAGREISVALCALFSEGIFIVVTCCLTVRRSN